MLYNKVINDLHRGNLQNLFQLDKKGKEQLLKKINIAHVFRFDDDIVNMAGNKELGFVDKQYSVGE